MVEVMPVVIVALESVTKRLDRCFEKLGITNIAAVMQKTTFLGTGRILKKGLKM